MCQLSLETLLPFPTLHRCRSPRTDPHRQHTVKRLSLFQGSKQTYIDLHKQKAISPARVLCRERSSVFGVSSCWHNPRPRRSSRTGDLGGGQVLQHSMAEPSALASLSGDVLFFGLL